MGSWRESMLAALVAALARPGWWSMALAGFLVRGGLLVVLLPIVILPTPAALANALSPTIQSLVFGGLTVERALLVVGIALALFVAIVGAGLAGAWLDLAQLREAAAEDELELGWQPAHASAREALELRLAAHLPTLAVLAYAAVRLVTATYDELLGPGDATVPLVLRVAQRAPDAVLLLAAAWLLGETVGSLAARRATAGATFRDALLVSTRQVLGPRGLATLVLTTAVLAGVLLPFVVATGNAWDHVRLVLVSQSGFGQPDPVQVGAALLVLVASWILGLAVLGAALAWRGAAWTAEVGPRLAAIAVAGDGAARAPGTEPEPTAG